ncbi:hypothetical protein Ancab_001558 [Ancistrocladus abbreviatus]
MLATLLGPHLLWLESLLLHTLLIILVLDPIVDASRRAMESRWFYRGTAHGSVPDYGAIFMSNTSTRKECFERRLFGLPITFLDFVTKVKTGMLLFLFDYEERKLYGVFEASSDGTMNISSDAYKSSGKQFPAQVRFSIVWRCSPIPEGSFRDVIKENYFTPYKFNFGLSKDQVCKLLFQFEKSRVRSYKVIKEVKFANQHDPANVDPQTQIAPEIIPSIDNAELILEKPARMEVSEDSVANNAEDFIPLPSLDAAEIEALFSDGFGGEWDLDTFLGCHVDTGCLHENFDSSNGFPFLEEGECLLNQDIFSSKSQSPENQEDCDHIPSHSEYQVGGLYSDALETRTSVFSRLTQHAKVTLHEEILENKGDTERNTVRAGVFSSLTRNSEVVLGQNETDAGGPTANIILGKKGHTERSGVFSCLNHHTEIALQQNRIDSGGTTVNEILERLEQNYKKWMDGSRNCRKSKDGSRNCRKSNSSMGHDVFKTQRKRPSVFSRLNYRSMQEEGQNKVKASHIRNLNSHKHVQQGKVVRETERHEQNYKCDDVQVSELTFSPMTIPLKPENEVKGTGGRHGSKSSCGSQKKQKKRRLNGQSSDDKSFDLETCICDSYSSVQAPGQGNSEALGKYKLEARQLLGAIEEIRLLPIELLSTLKIKVNCQKLSFLFTTNSMTSFKFMSADMGNGCFLVVFSHMKAAHFKVKILTNRFLIRSTLCSNRHNHTLGRQPPQSIVLLTIDPSPLALFPRASELP